MLSEFSRDDQMVLKPSNINNRETETGGLDLEIMENSEEHKNLSQEKSNIANDTIMGAEKRAKTSDPQEVRDPS